MHLTTQPKRILGALSVGVLLLAPLVAQSGAPPPPPQGPFPIVAFKAGPVNFSTVGLCSKPPCQGASVHTGPLNALDAQGFPLDYIISAKTIVARKRATIGLIGSCQLYAVLSGSVVNIDLGNINLEQPLGFGGNGIVGNSDSGKTVNLQGALCPDNVQVDDVGVICWDYFSQFSGNTTASYSYNTVLTMIPFSTANSPIDNKSASSEQISFHSTCSPGKFHTAPDINK